MRARALLLLRLLLIAAAAVAPVHARSIVIDDTGTLPYDAPLVMRWEHPTPRGPGNNLLVGTTTVRVRLNVAPWLHRPARIYLLLPAQQPGSLAASWTTQGRLLGGRVTSGSRTLVYAGLITTPYIEDVLQLTLNVDARNMRQLYHINFQFQMDEQ